jgi:hypothetical protein
MRQRSLPRLPALPSRFAVAVLMMASSAALAAPLPSASAQGTTGVTVKEKKQKPAPKTTRAEKKPATTAAAARPEFKPVQRSFLMVASDAPLLADKTISVVTESREFATIQVGIATRMKRGDKAATLEDIRPGDRLRCQGYWDVDGYRFHANAIEIGGRMPERAVDRLIAEACERVGKSRISGGFGVASTAPAAGTPSGRVVTPAGGGGAEAKPDEKPATEGEAKPAEGKPADPAKPTGETKPAVPPPAT